MKPFQIDIPPHVVERIRHLHPDIKKSQKAALRGLTEDPKRGEPLLSELKDYWKYRVKRFRVVYSVDRSKRLIRIFAIGHRRKIYEEVAELVKLQKRDKGRTARFAICNLLFGNSRYRFDARYCLHLSGPRRYPFRLHGLE